MNVAALDRVKEEVAYLKFWQGISVVTGISLVGWLVSGSDSPDSLRFVLAVAGVLVLTSVAMALHRDIKRRIGHIGAL